MSWGLFFLFDSLLVIFIVARLFPALRFEFSFKNWPVDEMPRLCGVAVLLAAYSVVITWLIQLIIPTVSGVSSRGSIFTSPTASMLISTIFIAPFVEEIIYRGIFTESLRWALNKVHVKASFLVSSIIVGAVFVSMHIPESTNIVVTLFTVGPLAAVLAWQRKKNGIMAGMYVHMIYNMSIIFAGIVITKLLV